MSKSMKIVLITLLVLLVFFSIFADLPIGQMLKTEMNLNFYLKLTSLFGLLIAVFMAWGYRSKVNASQKYRRAEEMVSNAEKTFERKKQACDQMELRLKAKYDEKFEGLDSQIEDVRKAYRKRLKALKEQNLELKETVGKLMSALKQERQKRG